MAFVDTKHQARRRTPEELIEHLKGFELELKFSAGVWFFFPGGGRFLKLPHDVVSVPLVPGLEVLAVLRSGPVQGPLGRRQFFQEGRRQHVGRPVGCALPHLAQSRQEPLPRHPADLVISNQARGHMVKPRDLAFAGENDRRYAAPPFLTNTGAR